MEKILIYIKHHLPIIWRWIEVLNSLLFSCLHGKKFRQILSCVINEHSLAGFSFKQIEQNDLKELESLLMKQSSDRMKHYNPHKFDLKSLQMVFNNKSFFMMGVYENDKLVGYFFLRCFWNKKCFVGRLIDEPFEGKGIGRVMNEIMYNTAWRAGFKCLSTISKNNKMVMRSHSHNNSMVILKELPNDYLFVEFIQNNKL